MTLEPNFHIKICFFGPRIILETSKTENVTSNRGLFIISKIIFLSKKFIQGIEQSCIP
jgi:hypothetical protein